MDYKPSPPCWLPATPLHVTPASLLFRGQREGSASLQQLQPGFALLAFVSVTPSARGRQKENVRTCFCVTDNRAGGKMEDQGKGAGTCLSSRPLPRTLQAAKSATGTLSASTAQRAALAQLT